MFAFLLPGSTVQAATKAETGKKDLTPITLQLRWYHQFQFAGYYAAQAKGFYEAAGLDVTIIERDANQDPISEVLEGRAQFGVTNAEVLLHALNGKPLTVLAAIFQHSPLALLTRDTPNITTPHDLVNKRVKMSRHTRDVELQAMLLNEGMTLDQLELTDGEAGKKDYLDPSLDALAAYVTNQPYYLEQLNIPYSLMLPRRYGIDFYGDCLFTTTAMTDDQHDTVRAFAEASLRGWEYAMKHPAEIIELILEEYPDRKPKAHLEFEAEQLQTLILPELVRIGHMNPGRWEHIAETFASLGMVDPQSVTPKFFSTFIHSPHDHGEIIQLHRTVRILWSAILIGLAVVAFLLFVTRKMRQEIKRRKEAETLLKEREEFHRILFEHTGTCTCVVEKNGLITMANKECEHLFKTTKDEFVGKRKWHEYVVPEDLPGMLERSSKRHAGETLPSRYDFRFQTDDKKIRNVQLSVGLVPGTARSLCSLNDVTPRIQAEQELEETIAELEVKNEELERFAYTVSHDLKSPLITIKGFSGLLSEAIHDNDDELAHKSIDRIDNAANTMLHLMEELLNLSRVGRIGNDPEDCSLLELANEAVTQTTGLLKISGAIVSVDPGLPQVFCDPTRIMEVLTNFIENAVRYGNPDGQTSIEIGWREEQLASGGRRVYFVRDNGIGIDEKYSNRVFNLFEQLNPGQGGTGIGLALVRRIIEHHRGEVWVESDGVGLGSTFCFTLGIPRKRG